jgi:peroxiredoxin
MSKNNNLKYPEFDTLEIVQELEYHIQSYEKLTPVVAGEVITKLIAPQANSKHSFFQGNAFKQPASVAPYLNKTLVVYFYSKHWGDVGLAHLKQLNAIRHEVKYHDANLLIIDADGTDSDLQRVIWTNNLSLTTYNDDGNKIAELFGVYSEKSPAWSKYAGVEENVPLPSLYVLDQSLQVVFAHANEDILTNLPVNDISNAVYQANTYFANRRSA